MFLKFVHNSLSIKLLSHKHSIFPMNRISVFLHFLDLLNSLYCLNIKISIVSLRLHLNLLHLKGLIILEFLSMDLSISLSPLNFLRVMFSLEVQVTLGPAKSKNLTIVSHELHSMSRIDRRSTKITFLDSHL
jgi:hypothetical protein